MTADTASVRIACQQLAPVIGELAGNAARAQAAIDEAIEAGADVIVLPELCTSGYVFADAAEAATLAIGRDDPILAGWGSVAQQRGVVVAGGFCERGEDGRLYNSAVLFDGEGGPPVFYRKLHLWDREKLVFTPGSELPHVVETRVGRVALVVCFDLEFPELTRSVALAGAQLLLVPTNWPLMERPAGERPAEVVIAMATARINRMAIACCDRAGIERGQAWTQGATIVDADGWVAGERSEPGLLVGEVDLAHALDKRLTEHVDLLGDRRPELYGALVTGGESDAPR